MCSATLWGLPGALVCTQAGEHRTHTFESTFVDDGRHNDDASQEESP